MTPCKSDIIIEVKDMIKKSKQGSGLNSYKISVKAEDLKKALDPSIWPMRVKVREYIYYPRKHQQQQNSGYQGQAGHYGAHGVQGQGGGAVGGAGVGHGHGFQPHERSGVHGQGSGANPGGPGQVGQGHVGGSHDQVGGLSPQQHGQWNGAPTFNRYEVLDTRP